MGDTSLHTGVGWGHVTAHRGGVGDMSLHRVTEGHCGLQCQLTSEQSGRVRLVASRGRYSIPNSILLHEVLKWVCESEGERGEGMRVRVQGRERKLW